MGNTKILGTLALCLLLSLSVAFAEVNDKTAIKVGKSSSDYQYGAFYTLVGADSPIQTVLIFNQSDAEFGFLSPKSRFLIFYADGGVNFHTLKQEWQRDCSSTPSLDWEDCPTIPVPETSYITMREFFGSIGYEYGLLRLETSVIYATVQGNYYLENQRYAVDENFILQRVAAIVEKEIFDWFAIGGEGSAVATTAGGSRNIETDKQTYVSYSKVSAYVKILW